MTLTRLTCIIMLIASAALASDGGEQVQALDTRIETVTVFPDRARITRVARVDLEPGNTSFLIEQLPFFAIPESFTASVNGVGVKVLGLRHWPEVHLEAIRQEKASLEARIRHISLSDSQAVADRIEAFREQKRFLTSVAQSSNDITHADITNGQFSVDQWGSAFDFVGTKLMQASDSIRYASLQLDSLARLVEVLRTDLDDSSIDSDHSSQTVQIDLNVIAPCTAILAIEYVIASASWLPLYDVRLSEDETNAAMNYSAEVIQNTGEDWNDVELILSTSEPSKGTGPGRLRSQNLRVPMSVDDIIRPTVSSVHRRYGELRVRYGRSGEVSYIVDGVETADPLGGYRSVARSFIGGSRINTTFTAPRRETVPSNETVVRIPIEYWNLDAEVRVICRAQNREGAYRIATITNQDEAPLMPGNVNIFVESNFLGTAELRRSVVQGQKFDLPFGLDRSVQVKRETVRKKVSYDSDEIELEKDIEITVMNHGSSERSVLLEEALPVSQDNRIKVKLGDMRPEPLEGYKRGVARWEMQVQPGEEMKVTVSYKVKWDKEITVEGLFDN